MKRGLLMLAFGFACLLIETEAARAQNLQPGQDIIRNATINRPTVSPYLNLLRNQGTGLPSYQTLVQPQLEQRRINNQQARAVGQLRQEVSRDAVLGRSGSQTVLPTGHISTYMEYSHFYRMGRQRR